MQSSITEGPNVIVVSGPPRTGTTLFSALLDGHPDINWLPDEGYFMEHLWTLKDGPGHDGIVSFFRGNIETFIEGIRERLVMPRYDGPLIDFPDLQIPWREDIFRDVIAKAQGARTVRDVWAGLRDAYIAGLEKKPRRYVCLKAADVGRSVFGALTYIPGSKGIIVSREPVAMMNSLKRYRQRRNEKLLNWPTLLNEIRDMNVLAEQVQRFQADSNFSNHLMVITYEQLSTSPKTVMKDVARFLGIEWNPSLVSPSMLEQPWTSNSSFISNAGTEASPTERPRMLTNQEIEIVRETSGPYREVFGYTDDDTPSLSTNGV